MATTEKRINMALTKEDLRILDKLEKQFGENTCQVLKRGIMLLDVYSKLQKTNEK